MRIYGSEVTGSLRVKGDIFAENYIVKSTVSTITQSFSSGSTIFGDSTDDTHQFTGSQSTTGTGSFGNVEILGSGLPTKVGANTLNISKDSVSSENNLQISIQGNDLMGMVMHEDGARRAAVY